MCNLAFYRMKYKNQNSTLPARAYPNTPLFESALNIAGALATIKKMNYLRLFILFMSLCNLTSCRKENEDIELNNVCISHQLPGDYFPAYPNSWWRYTNGDNELVEYKISNDYQECEGKCRPVFSNLNKCIQANSLIQRFYAGLGTSAILESPIYSTIIDSVLVCPISFSTFQQQDAFLGPDDVRYRRKATTMDTIITINGMTYTNVLIVYEYDKFDSLHRYYDYFAENIGLIKRDSVNHRDTTDLVEILRLESFNVEK